MHILYNAHNYTSHLYFMQDLNRVFFRTFPFYIEKAPKNQRNSSILPLFFLRFSSVFFYFAEKSLKKNQKRGCILFTNVVYLLLQQTTRKIKSYDFNVDESDNPK